MGGARQLDVADVLDNVQAGEGRGPLSGVHPTHHPHQGRPGAARLGGDSQQLDGMSLN